MPRKPLRPCAQPGCPEVVVSGRCAVHAAQIEAARGTSAARGYGSAWQRRRIGFLRRNPTCVVPGCARPATDVDHKTRRSVLVDAGVLDPDADYRLQALCHQHHSAKTAAETGFGGGDHHAA